MQEHYAKPKPKEILNSKSLPKSKCHKRCIPQQELWNEKWSTVMDTNTVFYMFMFPSLIIFYFLQKSKMKSWHRDYRKGYRKKEEELKEKINKELEILKNKIANKS